MILVTSINPNSENCLDAIKTWSKYGKIYSLNSEKELERFGTYGWEDVTFISTHRIMNWNGRQLVSINAMFDLAIEKDDNLLLINSDIIIDKLPEFKDDGITILTRCDYKDSNTIEQGGLYEHGFDAFYIPKYFLKQFPPTIYCMGNTFWDYSLPFRYLTSGILVYWPQGKSIFHKIHPFQWDYNEWQNMATFFKLEFKIDNHISSEQMSTNILAEIKNKSIK